MADIWTKERRSEVMRKVRSRGNATTEVKLLMLFREAGITGWRRHVPIMGRPDFAFLRKKLAIFVDGDFWHGRGNRAVPVSNRRFWCAKFEQNKKRDRFVNRKRCMEHLLTARLGADRRGHTLKVMASMTSVVDQAA
jgi:DNA mismatch endonuclease (patch repair protein)